MNPLISVIVPVYNTGKYLQKCLDSVLSQTYDNLEIVIIDDGSTDDSAEICREYAKKNNVVFLSQNHSGQATARNKGIQNSKGEFLGFVDSDDFVSQSMYSALYRMMEETDCDIACCGISRVQLGETITEKFDDNPLRIHSYSSEEAYKELLFNKKITSSLCDKLFSRQVFENNAFVDGMYLEDLEIMPKLIKNANKISYIETQLYYYVQSPNSTLRSSFSTRDFDLLKAWDSRFQFYKENAPQLVKLAYAQYLEELLLLIYKAKGDNEYSETREKLRRTALNIKSTHMCSNLVLKTKLKMFALQQSLESYDRLMDLYRRIK